MKLTVVLILIALLATIIFLAATILLRRVKLKRVPLEFNLLTANVGNASPLRILNHFKLHNNDIPVLRYNIGSIYPDIIFLQELSGEHQVELLLNLEMYHAHYRNGNCTAARKDVFLSLQPVDSLYENDGYTEYRVSFRDNDYSLILINVHTAAPISDPTFGKRGVQIRTLLEELKAQAALNSLVIAAGDFNFDPDNFESFRHRIIQTDSLTELDKTKLMWNVTIREGKENALRLVSPDISTWNIINISYNIDHIIANVECSDCIVLNEESNKLDIDRSEILYNANHNFMDHCGIIAKFVI